MAALKTKKKERETWGKWSRTEGKRGWWKRKKKTKKNRKKGKHRKKEEKKEVS